MAKESNPRHNSCCFTGHRPEKLKYEEQKVKELLVDAIRRAEGKGYTTFITGMSRGVDIWAGEAVLQLSAQNPIIKLVAASPFEGFDEKWSAYWKDKYHFLIQRADEVRYICPRYSEDAFQKRNEWMVNHSSLVIACYNGEPGGTRNTILYAERQGVEVTHLFQQ